MKTGFRENKQLIRNDVLLKLLIILGAIGLVLIVAGLISLTHPGLLVPGRVNVPAIADAGSNAAVKAMIESGKLKGVKADSLTVHSPASLLDVLESFRSGFNSGIIRPTFRSYMAHQSTLLIGFGVRDLLVALIWFLIRKKRIQAAQAAQAEGRNYYKKVFALTPETVVGLALMVFAFVLLDVMTILNSLRLYPLGDKSWIMAGVIGAILIASAVLTLRKTYTSMDFGKKTGMWGIIFLLPWTLGFFLFFFVPMLQEFRYSFEDVQLKAGRMEESFVAFKHYIYLIAEDPTYVRTLVETMLNVLLYTALIIVFSLLCAILLNGKFFGRSVARAIFFIPIVMATGLMLERVSNTEGLLMAQSQDEQVYGAAIVSQLLFSLGVGKEVVSYLAGAVNDIFSVVSQSGIQILIFLAALQSIPPQLYEVAKIEGATGYQTFWKVTVVMVSPMILTCTLYTISDLFLRSDLPDNFQDYAFNTGMYGRPAAMSLLFLLGVLIVLGLYILPLRKMVFYYD